jgi:hypothetical protein
MKTIAYFFLLCGISGLSACQNKMPPTLEEKLAAMEKIIETRVSQDMAALATFESSYTLVYKNFKPGWFWDDFYIREEVARVPYGYDLSDLAVRVLNDGGKNILLVSLPSTPKRMPIDRRITISDTTCPTCEVKDKDKNRVDVDAEMNKTLTSVMNQYEKHTIEQGRTLTRQYFANLAKGFGLELKLEFMD